MLTNHLPTSSSSSSSLPQDQIRSEVYDADAEEEFEDSEGNVLNRRTYEDLTRQGLL